MRSLEEKLRKLKLHAMCDHLERVLDDAARNNLSPVETIERLAEFEIEERFHRAVDRRFSQSRLAARPSIDQFNFHHHRSRLQHKNAILSLLDLDFISSGTNVILIGNPGTGKTFLAQIIATRACQKNHRVLFTTAMDMLNQLSASHVDRSLVRKLRLYTDPSVLVCDELGYLALDQETSNLFYQVISGRYSARRSTIITTNTPFSEWGNILYNTTIATAIADRLVENSEILLLGGDSLRKAKKGSHAKPA